LYSETQQLCGHQ